MTEGERVKVGTRVRICRDSDFGPGPWPDEPTGTIIAAPQGSVSEPVDTTSGVRMMFWVAFDEPQFGADGDGPYPRAQVLDKYVEILAD